MVNLARLGNGRRLLLWSIFNFFGKHMKVTVHFHDRIILTVFQIIILILQDKGVTRLQAEYIMANGGKF